MVTFIPLTSKSEKTLVFSKPGSYVVFLHNLSGFYEFDIRSEEVNLDIYGLYVGNDRQEFDVHTIQRHRAPRSTSNLFIKGIFDGHSKFRYEGLVRIEKKAQKTHAYQKNKNLLLSPTVFVESKPYLEILANDVYCTHGSTTGRINKDMVFYAMTRGLSSMHAEKMVVKGFIDELLISIKRLVPTFKYINDTN